MLPRCACIATGTSLCSSDYPLLWFYSALCVVYVAYGVVWLVLCFLRWRDLLRLQYWIAAVILLGGWVGWWVGVWWVVVTSVRLSGSPIFKTLKLQEANNLTCF